MSHLIIFVLLKFLLIFYHTPLMFFQLNILLTSKQFYYSLNSSFPWSILRSTDISFLIKALSQQFYLLNESYIIHILESITFISIRILFQFYPTPLSRFQNPPVFKQIVSNQTVFISILGIKIIILCITLNISKGFKLN